MKITYDDCIDYINQNTTDQYEFLDLLYDNTMLDYLWNDYYCYDDGEFVTMDELLDAYEDCRRKKKKSPSYQDFKINESENLIRLYHELNDGTYQIGKSICFVINQTKLREVFAADFKDRIVHHLIIKKFIKYFEDYFIDNSYSCRVGKGTLKGIQDAYDIIQKFDNNCWVFKGDIENFFMSIDKNILADELENFIREKYHGPHLEKWISLIRMEALHRPQDNCEKHGSYALWKDLPDSKSLFTIAYDCGLAIGNLTSQVFANFYMSGFDHFMSTYNPDIFYGRYVDDFVIIGKDKKLILEMVNEARKYLKKYLKLDLHHCKWQLQHSSKGFPFLGNVIKNERRYMINRTIRKALNTVTDNTSSIKKYIQRINSYLGYLFYCDSYEIRKKIWDSIPEERKYFLYANQGLYKVQLRKKRYSQYIKSITVNNNFLFIESSSSSEFAYVKKHLKKHKINKIKSEL